MVIHMVIPIPMGIPMGIPTGIAMEIPTGIPMGIPNVGARTKYAPGQSAGAASFAMHGAFFCLGSLPGVIC